MDLRWQIERRLEERDGVEVYLPKVLKGEGRGALASLVWGEGGRILGAVLMDLCLVVMLKDSFQTWEGGEGEEGGGEIRNEASDGSF